MQSFGADLYKFRTGILLGAAIGLFSGGFPGLIFGGILGFSLERIFRKAATVAPQQIFFKATFTVMGRIAKADGQVTENEIDFARAIMGQMRLNEEKRLEAIQFFTEGKDAGLDLDPVLQPLTTLFKYQPNLRLIFLEIQLQAALADGEMSDPERKVITDVCIKLGLPADQIEALLARMQAERAFHRGQGGAPTAAQISQAYGVLGVSDSASDGEVKRAWRKLMSQHHPDKLVSKGLPQEMMQIAKEKTQEIQAAYDLIRQVRG